MKILGEIKEAKKGIPHGTRLEMDVFKECLYGEGDFIHTVEVNSLRLDRDKRMTRTRLRKMGLSDIHIKLGVQRDKITCEPLKKDQKFL